MRTSRKWISVCSGCALGLAVTTFWVFVGCGTTTPLSQGMTVTELVGPQFDWQVQTFVGSQGITAVRYDPRDGGCLVLDCDLKCGDPRRSEGEVFLDLGQMPGLEREGVPLDLRGHTIRMEAAYGSEFLAPDGVRNTCQLFVRDSASAGSHPRTQYGRDAACGPSGEVEAGLSPSSAMPDGGDMAPGFRPDRIQTIGIKLATKGRAAKTYRCRVRVTSLTISRSLPRSDLPAESTELISPELEWQMQDSRDGQNASRVAYDPQDGCIVLDCDFGPQIPESREPAQCETFVDLKYVLQVEDRVPLDLSRHRIEMVAECGGGSSVPDASLYTCQLLVKDEFKDGVPWNGKAQYGRGTSLGPSGDVRSRLIPSLLQPEGGYMDAGFRPDKVQTIGIKLDVGNRAADSRHCRLKIRSLTVTPPLPVRQLPELPDAPTPDACGPELREDGFYVEGRQRFLVGGNWRMLEYGTNFGATAWFPTGNGVHKHRNYLRQKLRVLRRAGVSLVRVGLLDNGIAVLDHDGTFIGEESHRYGVFRRDVAAFLELLAETDMLVEFVLVDFQVAGRGEWVPTPKAENSVWVRGRASIFRGKREEFMTKFLVPFLREFGDHPNVFGIDVINEPEWVVKDAELGGWYEVRECDPTRAPEEEALSVPRLRGFVSEAIKHIRRECPRKFVTVGVSCTHTALVRDLDLSYHALHFYPWMMAEPKKWHADLKARVAEVCDGQPVTMAGFLAAVAPPGKPWMLEEFPGSYGALRQECYRRRQEMRPCDAADDWEPVPAVAVAETLQTTYGLRGTGAAGTLVWNLSPGIDCESPTWGSEEQMLQDIRRFAEYVTRE